MSYKLLKEIVINHFVAMEKVGKIGPGHLTEPEKYQFVNLLKKLESFHNDINLNQTIQEIVNRSFLPYNMII